MVNIHDFKERVFMIPSQFELEYGRKTHRFVKYRIGKATYVFGDYYYDGRMDLDAKLSLKAIASDGKLYIMDTWMFNEDKENYPTNVFTFNRKIKEVNDYIRNELFAKYYEALQIRELTEDEKKRVINQVREAILCDGGVVKEYALHDIANNETIALYLRGELKIEEYANEHFEKHKDDYISIKSKNHELRKLIEKKYNVHEWEIALTNSIRELDIKNVTVDFDFKGNSGSEKVEKNVLLRVLYNNGYFSDWEFANKKNGKVLLDKLGAGDYGGHVNGTLRCEHIESIRYGKKVIYSKQDVLQKAVVN